MDEKSYGRRESVGSLSLSLLRRKERDRKEGRLSRAPNAFLFDVWRSSRPLGSSLDLCTRRECWRWSSPTEEKRPSVAARGTAIDVLERGFRASKNARFANQWIHRVHRLETPSRLEKSTSPDRRFVRDVSEVRMPFDRKGLLFCSLSNRTNVVLSKRVRRYSSSICSSDSETLG